MIHINGKAGLYVKVRVPDVSRVEEQLRELRYSYSLEISRFGWTVEYVPDNQQA